MHDLRETIHDLETAAAAADAAVSLAETTAQGARQAATAGRTVLTILRGTIGRMRLATMVTPPPIDAVIHADLVGREPEVAVEAPPVEVAVEAPPVEVAGATVFYCRATNCRGLGWRPREDFPHPRTCLPDDQQAAWPGFCAIER